ncbi:GPP34 family phosphoprotein [Streptosporangiaceae bacterium NEAU-GS5]|nr:GPP34 family phosphoprotein [Streptosporangiaceae bacterium NEAU-GS5]
MTTPRDLMITAIGVTYERPVEQGDLSLALAGAELIDLLRAGAVALDGDTIVPDHQAAIPDRLLAEASGALARETPYESVGDWLWRRGRGLAAAYLTALENDGQLISERRGLFHAGEAALADSPDRRQAEERWQSDEPVLAALASAVGIRAANGLSPADDAVEIVLATVNDAVLELEGIRQRLAVEQAAFDNIWRGSI